MENFIYSFRVLSLFQDKFNLWVSIRIFGEKQGPHLFKKFRKCEYNLLRLWVYLDLENKKKLVDYVKSNNDKIIYSNK